jgi:ABC-type multidrug transport system fused ATPase/permease subunit
MVVPFCVYSRILSVVFPYFLVPAFFIGYGFRELAIGYLNTGRDLRRMESNTRSPIFSDFGELLEGIVTVRAFSAERRFLNNLHAKIDLTTKVRTSPFSVQARDTVFLLDVVYFLDDQPLVAPQLRHSRRTAVLVTMLLSISILSDGAGLAALCITSAMAFTNSGEFWS